MDEKTFKGWGGLLGWILAFTVVAGLLPAVVTRDWPASPGEFAAMFGFAEALISALAFGAFFFALRMQAEELRLQRQELKDTREELKRQAAAQETTGRMNLVSTYLSAVSAAVQHDDAYWRAEESNMTVAERSHRQRRSAVSCKYADQLDILIALLTPDVRRNVPKEALDELPQRIHERFKLFIDGWLSQDDILGRMAQERIYDDAKTLVTHLQWMAETPEDSEIAVVAARFAAAFWTFETRDEARSAWEPQDWTALKEAYGRFQAVWPTEKIVANSGIGIMEAIDILAERAQTSMAPS